jgi:hypothetical protein
MTINNIDNRLAQLKAYDSRGTQTIIQEQFAKDAISLLDDKLLSDPNTTYLDPQCGSGTLLMYLAQRLMTTLSSAIPNELDRIEHIFSNQLYASDIDSLQTLVCKTNFKKALNNKAFNVNVTQQDYADVNSTHTVILSAVDFTTTNNFVSKFKEICKHVLVLTRPNKNRYTKKQHIREITKYRFLGVTKSTTPICAMYFTEKTNNKVEFITSDSSVIVDSPAYLPAVDLKTYMFAKELFEQNFETFTANYGSYYVNDKRVVNNPGDVELIYQVGSEGAGFRKTVGVDESIITPREGVGVHKVVISKNGNRTLKSVLKYASPKYGTGHNAIWIQTKDKKEADEIINYYNSKEITRLVLSLNETSPANGTGFWSKIPHYKNYNKVKEIYAKHFS